VTAEAGSAAFDDDAASGYDEDEPAPIVARPQREMYDRIEAAPPPAEPARPEPVEAEQASSFRAEPAAADYPHPAGTNGSGQPNGIGHSASAADSGTYDIAPVESDDDEDVIVEEAAPPPPPRPRGSRRGWWQRKED
jgi:hypothetical protein